jgi:hypothetical protein
MKSQNQKQKKVTRKKLRIFAFMLFAVVALCLSVYQLSTAQKHFGNKSNAYFALPGQWLLMPPEQKTELIDGAKNPEKIPDHVAYAMVFRVIAGRDQESEKQSVRAYINQLGLGAQKCMSCPKEANKEAADPEIEAMFEAAQSYNQQVASLDMQAKAIKEATWRNPTAEARAELARLQKEKESLIKALVVSLHKRLGPGASARLSEQMNLRVKQRVQIKKSATAP